MIEFFFEEKVRAHVCRCFTETGEGVQAVLRVWVSSLSSLPALITHVYTHVLSPCARTLPPLVLSRYCIGFSEELGDSAPSQGHSRLEPRMLGRDPGSLCRAMSNGRHICPNSPLLFLATLSGPHSDPVLGLCALHRCRTFL